MREKLVGLPPPRLHAALVGVRACGRGPGWQRWWWLGCAGPVAFLGGHQRHEGVPPSPSPDDHLFSSSAPLNW